MILYWVIKISLTLSIFIVSLPEFSKIDSSMAKSTILKFEFFDLILIHFMFASFASIIISSHYRFSTDNTSWEIASTRFTNCIVFTDRFFAISSRALDPFSRSLFRRVLSKDVHCNFNVSFSLFGSSHSFKLYKCSWTLLIALNKLLDTLL
jgi:hypothetical protein